MSEFTQDDPFLPVTVMELRQTYSHENRTDKEIQPHVQVPSSLDVYSSCHHENESNNYENVNSGVKQSENDIKMVQNWHDDFVDDDVGQDNEDSSSVYENTEREHEELNAESLNEIPGTHFGRESCVMVKANLINGVIKWIGLMENGIMVGIETDEPIKSDNSANFEIHQKLKTPFNVDKDRVIYVYANEIEDDPRYKETLGYSHHSSIECEEQIPKYTPFPGKPALPPHKIFNAEDLEYICGSFKGIQGQHNSCYLDSSLFSMFAFTSIFDSLLNKEINETEFPGYDFQRILRDEIVNPLRIQGFVPWNPVMKLRSILEKRESGYTKEEKDPEEFLNMMFVEMFKAEPLLKLNSGQGSFFYQLFVEKDERLTFPTVQQLFDQSFSSSDVKLTETPSCLIIQMPRFGNKYKMYPRILPSHVLDITDILVDSPRQCTLCGKQADRECVDCFNTANEVSLETSTFCENCFIVYHKHNKRNSHKKVKQINNKSESMDTFKSMNCNVERIFMELFAVVCIETSHYVSFVKTGTGTNAPWCFFDSMADRKGGINGYNIPKLTSEEEISKFLSDDNMVNIQNVQKQAKRLLCDAYLCMYQSSDLAKYK